MEATIRRIEPKDRVVGQATVGMARQEAVATPMTWAGFVTTEPGMVSGWHHHADHESVVYVISGLLRMESGPGGQDVAEAEPGDFILIPAQVVHRESNPSPDQAEVIVFRSGAGPVVVNVDGPDS